MYPICMAQILPFLEFLHHLVFNHTYWGYWTYHSFQVIWNDADRQKSVKS